MFFMHLNYFVPVFIALDLNVNFVCLFISQLILDYDAFNPVWRRNMKIFCDRSLNIASFLQPSDSTTHIKLQCMYSSPH